MNTKLKGVKRDTCASAHLADGAVMDLREASMKLRDLESLLRYHCEHLGALVHGIFALLPDKDEIWRGSGGSIKQ